MPTPPIHPSIEGKKQRKKESNLNRSRGSSRGARKLARTTTVEAIGVRRNGHTIYLAHPSIRPSDTISSEIAASAIAKSHVLSFLFLGNLMKTHVALRWNSERENPASCLLFRAASIMAAKLKEPLASNGANVCVPVCVCAHHRNRNGTLAPLAGSVCPR